jgi:hypothetical protein
MRPCGRKPAWDREDAMDGDFRRALIAAGRAETAPAGAEGRVLERLAVAPSPPKPHASLSLAGKALVALVGAGAIVHFAHTPSPSTTTPSTTTPSTLEPRVRRTEEPPSVSTLRAEPRAAAVVPGPPAHQARPAPQDSFAAEVALLGKARRAKLDGDPQTCIHLLQTHERAFPSSSLAMEREVLFVEAEHAAGRVDQATLRAESFGQRYPGSPYASKVARFRNGGTP